MISLHKPIKFNKERGVYSVEFAIVGGLFFLLLFAVLEVGRLFFVWNVLTEASRRGARLATVCYFDTTVSTDLKAYEPMLRAAMFDNSTLAPSLTWSNLKVSYLNFDGSLAADKDDIELVRAEIINYQHQLIIPGLFITLNSPSFATTLPRESLGVTRQRTTLCLPS